MLHNRSGRELTWRLQPMRDTRAPDASPYVGEITLNPDESGIYDALGRLRQFKQDRDRDVLISLTDLPLRRGRQPVTAEVLAMSSCCRCPAGSFRPRGSGTESARGGRCRYCPRRSRQTPRLRALAGFSPRIARVGRR
jgi:hypothetical protein